MTTEYQKDQYKIYLVGGDDEVMATIRIPEEYFAIEVIADVTYLLENNDSAWTIFTMLYPGWNIESLKIQTRAWIHFNKEFTDTHYWIGCDGQVW